MGAGQRRAAARAVELVRTRAALATLQVLLCLVLFAASALHVRWRLKVARRAADGAAPTSPGTTA